MDCRSRILVVDDDMYLLEQLEQILREEYLVSMAPSGDQALRYLRSGHWVDLVLLDILMPGQDGYETLAEIRSIPRHRHTPVIFLTSLMEPEAEAKGLQLGADYVTKPYTPVVLRSRIERALRTRGCLDSVKLNALSQPLSETEYYAAMLIAQGYSNEEIAQILNYTLGSVKNLLGRVMNKLDINGRKEIEAFKR